jgi:hypothetical protein
MDSGATDGVFDPCVSPETIAKASGCYRRLTDL